MNWIAVRYKSIREDVKWCTANGYIVVGDRKWWSTLSDSLPLLGGLGKEGKFIRRGRSFPTVPTGCTGETMATDDFRLYHIVHKLQEERNTSAQSIACYRQLIESRP